MKTSTKRLLLGAALVAVTLCAAPTEARRAASSDTRDGAHFYGLGELFSFDGINVEQRDGEVVGMNVLQRDGSWLLLRRQSTPNCPTNCSEGQKLSCWEDERQLMRVCVCGSPGGTSRMRIRVIDISTL